MHGMGVLMSSCEGGNILDEGSKKREWKAGEEEQENCSVVQQAKKRKMCFEGSEAKHSEVKETSRNWSQSYK